MKRLLLLLGATLLLGTSSGCCAIDRFFHCSPCGPFGCASPCGGGCDDCGGVGCSSCGGGGGGGCSACGGGHSGPACDSCAMSGGHPPVTYRPACWNKLKLCRKSRYVASEEESAYGSGPPAAGVTYPYYVHRGPRDFLARNPGGIATH